MPGLSLLILLGASLTAVIVVLPLFVKLRAHVGGMGAITSEYGRRRALDDQHSWRSVSPLFVGSVDQRHAWTISVDDFGLHLVPLLPFRPLQAGVSIPYEDVVCRRVWSKSVMYVEFHFAAAPESSVRVDERQGFSILTASGGRLTFADSRATAYSEVVRRRQQRVIRERVGSNAE